MSVIDSPHNQHVKRLRALATKKGRAQHGQVLIEGTRALEEALEGGGHINSVAYCAELIASERAQAVAERLRERGAEFLEMTERAFRTFTQVEAPEGVAAVAAIPATGLADLSLTASLVLAAVDVRDPGNLGALVRTADAAGADAFIAAGSCADLYAPKVVRATVGSLFHLPCVQHLTVEQMLTWAGEAGLATVASCLERAKPYSAVKYPTRALVMMGSEAHGLSPALAGRADLQVRIPMPGRAESLNVAVAAGIVLFEILRQRASVKDGEGEK